MLPAVRAPDGSLVHILDQQYDPGTDFIMEHEGSEQGAVVERVDHLARVVPAPLFDAWVLFYRALLGLKADESLDLDDPHGVVRSRALHDTRNRLRMPLTFSETPNTVVARSLSLFGGAGINQIALGTDDIFAAVATMRDNGARILSIPANYYHDLAENRDVPADLVARLQEASILYDRDSNGGELFHTYTETFDGRFFFEILQRAGGYDRYGECNVPTRLAVQAHHHKRRAG